MTFQEIRQILADVAKTQQEISALQKQGEQERLRVDAMARDFWQAIRENERRAGREAARRRKEEKRRQEEEARHRREEARHRREEAQRREKEAQRREQAAKEAAVLREQAAKETAVLREQAAKEAAVLREQAAKEAAAREKEAEEAAERSRKIDRQLAELGKQLGGLGQKFGRLTEGLAFPSMERILHERFGTTAITPRFTVKRDGGIFESDVFAYRNGEHPAAFIIEVKSLLRQKGIDQILRNLEAFPNFCPEHRDKELYGIVAAVDVHEDLRRKVLAQGLYFAQVNDDVFQLDIPEGFEAKSFRRA